MPSTKFLFWNINRKPLAGLVADLAELHRIDVIILAECEVDPAAILLTLNQASPGTFHFAAGLCERIRIFTSFSNDLIELVFETARLSIRRIELPGRSPVLLAAAHFPSKLHWSGESQGFECGELARSIEAEEQKAGHRRTILVGDFNMNPFEAGIVSSGGLNAVMSRRVASRET